MAAHETERVTPHRGVVYPIWLQVLVIHLIGIIVSLFLYDLKFGTNDDSAMALIWQGAVNGVPENEVRLIFISAYIGEFLSALLRWFPDVDSYSLFQQASVLLSSVAICSTFLAIRRDWLGTLCALGYVLFYAVYFWRNIQFTQTSLSLIAAGLSIAFYAALVPRNHWLLWPLAVAFLVMGGLVREVSQNLIAVMILVLMPIIALSYWFGEDYKFSRQSELFKRLGLFACVGVCAVGSLILLERAENSHYYSSPEWQEFVKSQPIRSAIQHNIPLGFDRSQLNNIAAAQSGFSEDQIGAGREWLSTNDVALLRSWLIADNKMQSTKNLQQIALAYVQLPDGEIGLIDKLTGREIASWVKRYFEVVLTILIIPFAGFVLAIGLAFGGYFRRVVLCIGSSILWSTFFVALVLALGLYYRFPPPRVFVPLASILFALATLNALYFAGRFRMDRFVGAVWFEQIKRLINWRRKPATENYDESDSVTGFSKALCAILLTITVVSLSNALPWKYSLRTVSAQVFLTKACARSDTTLQWINSRDDVKIMLLPGLVHSHCYVQPHDINFPEILKDRGVLFGWMGYTPWLRGRLFAKHDTLYDVLCKEKGSALYAVKSGKSIFLKYVEENNLQSTNEKFDFEQLLLPPIEIERTLCRTVQE